MKWPVPWMRARDDHHRRLGRAAKRLRLRAELHTVLIGARPADRPGHRSERFAAGPGNAPPDPKYAPPPPPLPPRSFGRH